MTSVRIDNYKITEALSRFESEAQTDQFRHHGEWIWPVIRNWLCIELTGVNQFMQSAADSHQHSTCSKIQTFLSNLTKCFRNPLGSIQGDQKICALIFSNSSRLIEIEGKQYNYISDPLLERLEGSGIRAQSLEFSPHTSTTRTRPVIDALPYLDAQIRKVRFWRLASADPLKNPPQWFQSIANWTQDCFNYTLAWHDVYIALRYYFWLLRIFKKWLRQHRPAFLIIDCWYSLNAMALIRAAHEWDIPCVDLQHGLQGIAAAPYVYWRKLPAGERGCLPDFFIVWGESTAAELHKYNAPEFHQDRVFISGNYWLNLWLKPETDWISQFIAQARSIIPQQTEKVLLVTLQLDHNEQNRLIDVIRKSPATWFWLIRAHRRDHARLKEIEHNFQSSGHPRVNVMQSSTMPLYALMNIADIHLTWYSTCALEALPFGAPTVLLSPNGQIAYKDYIEQDVMKYASNLDQVLILVEECKLISNDDCRKIGGKVFANPDDSEKGMCDLLKRLCG
ncbi:hypothetical protein JXA32_11475 [Candidatus Sumerlaeota bacterium]|nr:hypothetical protein [Candidatus Sumerlaeota bacterium]